VDQGRSGARSRILGDLGVLMKIIVEPKRVFCPTHGEHLRAKWPLGFGLIGVRMVQAAMANPDFHKAAGAAKGEIAQAEEVNALTTTLPLCYFIEANVIKAAFVESGILTPSKCECCNVVRLGGPYTMRMWDDVSTEEKSVCMECALDAGRRLHARFPDGSPWDQVR
jgi:hypothetical protein